MQLAVNDIVEVKCYCQSEGQIAQNVYTYLVQSLTGDGPDDLDVAERFDAVFTSLMPPLLCNDALYLGTSAQIIKPTRRPAVLEDTGRSSGEGGDEQIPRQVAGLISLLTNTANKHGRGRKFIPFPSEEQNKPNGTPTDDYLVDLTNLAVQLITPQTVTGGGEDALLVPVLLDRSTGATKLIDRFRVRRVWATQRRRGDTRHADVSPF